MEAHFLPEYAELKALLAQHPDWIMSNSDQCILLIGPKGYGVECFDYEYDREGVQKALSWFKAQVGSV